MAFVLVTYDANLGGRVYFLEYHLGLRECVWTVLRETAHKFKEEQQARGFMFFLEGEGVLNDNRHISMERVEDDDDPVAAYDRAMRGI